MPTTLHTTDVAFALELMATFTIGDFAYSRH
jgi:hypothetical protein